MNSVQEIGRLTADPQPIAQTEHGPVTSFRLAVPRPKGSRKNADFFTVEVWGKQAESAAKWLKEGREVAIAGRLEQREWKTQDTDEYRERVLIVARTVDYLRTPRKDDEAQPGEAPATPEGDDIPF